MLPDRLYDGTKTPLGDSLAVEHLALTRVALVRIQVPQPPRLISERSQRHKCIKGFPLSRGTKEWYECP
jgi:hypothetical protein